MEALLQGLDRHRGPGSGPRTGAGSADEPRIGTGTGPVAGARLGDGISLSLWADEGRGPSSGPSSSADGVGPVSGLELSWLVGPG